MISLTTHPTRFSTPHAHSSQIAPFEDFFTPENYVKEKLEREEE